MNPEVPPAAPTGLKRGLAVYLVVLGNGWLAVSALLSLFEFSKTMTFFTWDLWDVYLVATPLLSDLMYCAVCTGATVTVFMLRKETLLFQGWILASALSGMIMAPSETIVMVIPSTMTALTLWLAFNGKLQ